MAGDGDAVANTGLAKVIAQQRTEFRGGFPIHNDRCTLEMRRNEGRYDRFVPDCPRNAMDAIAKLVAVFFYVLQPSFAKADGGRHRRQRRGCVLKDFAKNGMIARWCRHFRYLCGELPDNLNPAFWLRLGQPHVTEFLMEETRNLSCEMFRMDDLKDHFTCCHIVHITLLNFHGASCEDRATVERGDGFTWSPDYYT